MLKAVIRKSGWSLPVQEGDVAFASTEYRLSERRGSKLLGVEQLSYQYEPRPDRKKRKRMVRDRIAG